jgi:HD-GYP domain
MESIMKNIARMALEPGMVIGADILTKSGELLIADGTKVDPNVINKLTRHRIILVPIKEEVDFAKTHFEKVRLSKGFTDFEEAYLSSMPLYKEMMNQLVHEGIPFRTFKLMYLYHNVFNRVEPKDLLIDYLYSMTPTEDDLTYAHCFNSALIAGLFASWLSLSKEDTDKLVQCAFIYDVGKLKLPNELIWKAGKLTDIEFEKIKTHTILGFQMIQDMPLDPAILKATLTHHERYDGTGYPSRLHDKQIDIFSRYIAIIDAYEAMTAVRTYRQAKTPFEIIEIFENDAQKYDLDILDPILRNLAAHTIGLNIKLSDDQIVEIVMINKNLLTRPTVKTKKGDLIDLAERIDLDIIGIY